MSMEVYYSDYYSKLVDHDLIKSIVICNVNETTQCWGGEDNLEVHKPDINIEVRRGRDRGREERGGWRKGRERE